MNEGYSYQTCTDHSTFFLDSFFLGLFDLFKQGLLSFLLELGLEELVLSFLNLDVFRRYVGHANVCLCFAQMTKSVISLFLILIIKL